MSSSEKPSFDDYTKESIKDKRLDFTEKLKIKEYLEKKEDLTAETKAALKEIIITWMKSNLDWYKELSDYLELSQTKGIWNVLPVEERTSRSEELKVLVKGDYADYKNPTNQEIVKVLEASTLSQNLNDTKIIFAVQAWLNNYWIDSWKNDWRSWPKTQAAIKEFKKQYNLNHPDGQLDVTSEINPKTIVALKSTLSLESIISNPTNKLQLDQQKVWAEIDTKSLVDSIKTNIDDPSKISELLTKIEWMGNIKGTDNQDIKLALNIIIDKYPVDMPQIVESNDDKWNRITHTMPSYKKRAEKLIETIW